MSTHREECKKRAEREENDVHARNCLPRWLLRKRQEGARSRHAAMLAGMPSEVEGSAPARLLQVRKSHAVQRFVPPHRDRREGQVNESSRGGAPRAESAKAQEVLACSKNVEVPPADLSSHGLSHIC